MITADQKKAESAVDLLNNDFVIFKYFVLFYLVSSSLQTTLKEIMLVLIVYGVMNK